MHAWSNYVVRIILGAQTENFDVVYQLHIIVYDNKGIPIIVYENKGIPFIMGKYFNDYYLLTIVFPRDDVIKWNHFPRYWPYVRGIHRSPENSPHKGQWRGVLMFSLIWAWINGWVNNRAAGDLRRHRVHCHVTALLCPRMVLLSHHAGKRNHRNIAANYIGCIIS